MAELTELGAPSTRGAASGDTQRLRAVRKPTRATRSGLRAALGLARVKGKTAGSAESSDQVINDVQALLLQVSFAIMMVFMIAYFMFRNKSEQEAAEQVLELQRQQLVAAVDSCMYDSEARYGLNVLTSVDAAGVVQYRPEACVEKGRLTEVEQLRGAFCGGARNAQTDFADAFGLRRLWIETVLDRASVRPDELKGDNRVWLENIVDARLSLLRERVRNVQLLSASRLQAYWSTHPELIEDAGVAKLLDEFQEADEAQRLLLTSELARALRVYCLQYLAREAQAEMLP